MSGPFRDEQEAMRSRIAELERDNVALSEEVARLRGGDVELSIGEKLAGGPSSIVLEYTLEGEASDDALERAVERLRERYAGIGDLSRLGRTLAWRVGSPQGTSLVEVTFTIRDGQTRVRAVEKLAGLMGGIFGGIGGGVGGGGMGVIAPLAAMGFGPEAIVPTALIWLGGVFAFTRTLYANRARARRAQLETTMSSVVSHLEMAAKPRVRVEAEAPEKDDAGPSSDDASIEADEDSGPRGRARRWS